MEMSSINSHKSTKQQGDIYSSVLHVYSTIKNLYIYLVFYYYVYEHEWVGCGFQKFACSILSNVGFRDGELKSNLSCLILKYVICISNVLQSGSFIFLCSHF